MLEELKQRYLNFAEFEARNYSPSYWSFTTAVADDARVLELLATLPRAKQQPNLLLAVVRLLHGVVGSGREFCHVVTRDWDRIQPEILARSTQTNEPARCAVLLPVLAGLAEPIVLIEVGTSAGLCLFPDKYTYDYGRVQLVSGESAAPAFSCEVNKKTPLPSKLPEISWRGGIDIHPLSVMDEQDMEWLRLLVWPEHTERLENLNRAIQVAKKSPAEILEGDLVAGLEALVSRAPGDASTVVFHSAVLAYLPVGEREAFRRIVADLDLTWISNEHPSVFPDIVNQSTVEVTPDRFLLAVDGTPVAMTGPHGQSIDWF